MMPLPDLTDIAFNASSLDQCPPIPCASLLVRIERMTKREGDDTTPLISRIDTKPEEWISKGLYIEAPNYQAGFYDNSKCKETPLANETIMFQSKIQNAKDYSMPAKRIMISILSARWFNSTLTKLVAAVKMQMKERATALKELGINEEETKDDPQKISDNNTKSKLK
jgi:hypothetical protein